MIPLSVLSRKAHRLAHVYLALTPAQTHTKRVTYYNKKYYSDRKQRNRYADAVETVKVNGISDAVKSIF